MGMQPWISVAPVHVVVGVREESYHERYRKEDKLVDGEEITWPAPYWYVDSGSLFMLLQLAALDEGLGTGIYGVAGEDVPAAEGAASACPTTSTSSAWSRSGSGRPESTRAALVSRLTQARLPLDELVRWERWARRKRLARQLAVAADAVPSDRSRARRSRSLSSLSPHRRRRASSSATSTSPSCPCR